LHHKKKLGLVLQGLAAAPPTASEGTGGGAGASICYFGGHLFLDKNFHNPIWSFPGSLTE